MNNYNEHEQFDSASEDSQTKGTPGFRKNRLLSTVFRSLFSKDDLSLEKWNQGESKKYFRGHEVKNYMGKFDVSNI